MALSENPNSFSGDQQGSFLGPAKYIETEDHRILKLAHDLRVGKSLDTARSTFAWVAKSIRFNGYSAIENGALHALGSRQGDCTEFMDLFVALMRANDIPARGIAGYIVPESAILKPAEFHNWAEFLDNGVWKIADPQKKVFQEDQHNYIAMRIIVNSSNDLVGEFGRFDFKGEGLLVQMNQ